MTDIFEQLKYRFRQSDTLLKLLVVNIAVYLVLQIFKTLLFLFNGGDIGLFLTISEKLALPAHISTMIVQPWGLFSYMFLHTGFWHLLVNIIILYWTGNIFTEYLGEKKLLSTYILGGLTGGIAFILTYNFLPVFSEALPYANLRGASAGVIAILVAIATLIPNYVVNLLFIGPVKLMYIAIFLIVLYLISIPDGNAGGHIAHLGGALWGYFYVRQLNKGRDWAEGVNKIIAGISELFSSKRKIKVAYRNTEGKAKDDEFVENKNARQQIIDRILDKISRSGYSSLTKEEKEILFKASSKPDQ